MTVVRSASGGRERDERWCWARVRCEGRREASSAATVGGVVVRAAVGCHQYGEPIRVRVLVKALFTRERAVVVAGSWQWKMAW